MKNKVNSLDSLPLALRVEDLMPILGIGRNTAYELVRSGQIRSIRIGRKIRIPRDAVAEFLRR
jgi:excisionase family DNA binding protein